MYRRPLTVIVAGEQNVGKTRAVYNHTGKWFNKDYLEHIGAESVVNNYKVRTFEIDSENVSAAFMDGVIFLFIFRHCHGNSLVEVTNLIEKIALIKHRENSNYLIMAICNTSNVRKDLVGFLPVFELQLREFKESYPQIPIIISSLENENEDDENYSDIIQQSVGVWDFYCNMRDILPYEVNQNFFTIYPKALLDFQRHERVAKEEEEKKKKGPSRLFSSFKIKRPSNSNTPSSKGIRNRDTFKLTQTSSTHSTPSLFKVSSKPEGTFSGSSKSPSSSVSPYYSKGLPPSRVGTACSTDGISKHSNRWISSDEEKETERCYASDGVNRTSVNLRDIRKKVKRSAVEIVEPECDNKNISHPQSRYDISQKPFSYTPTKTLPLKLMPKRPTQL